MNNLYKEFSEKEEREKHAKIELLSKQEKKDLAEAEVRELWMRAQQATSVSDSLNQLFKADENPVVFAAAKTKLHNMDVIGMERMLKMHSTHTEESNAAAMIGLGAVVAFIIGIYFKFFEFSSELVSSNSKNIDDTIRKINENIEHVWAKWDTKLNVATIKKDEESKKTLESELKDVIERLETRTGTLAAEKIVKGEITFAATSDIIHDLAEKSKTVRSLIPELTTMTKSLMELEKETDLGTKPEHHDKLSNFSKSVLAFISNKDHAVRLNVDKLIIDVYKNRYRLTFDSSFPRNSPEDILHARENIVFIGPKLVDMKIIMKEDSLNKKITVRRLASSGIKIDTKSMLSVTKELVENNDKILQELEKLDGEVSKLTAIMKGTRVPQESDVMKDFKKATDNYKLSISILKDYIKILKDIIEINEFVRNLTTDLYKKHREAEVIVSTMDKAKQYLGISI